MTTLFGEQINTLNSEKIFYHLENGQYSAVSDVELIYSIVGNEELAGRIYQTAGKDWASLFKYSAAELLKIPGVGKKRAIALVAAMEMGRRKMINTPEKKKSITTSYDLYKELSPLLCDLAWEELWLVTLNGRGQITSKIQISKGGRRETSADITMILKKAIEKNAVGMALCHNHPSGETHPSLQDDKLTKQVSKAAELVGIKLLDHIIIGDNSYYSYADEGQI